MFSSIFSVSDSNAPNFHPVSDRYKEDELFGELSPKDTEWQCASGFVTETQVFYITTESGASLMCQVIHSATGMWSPTIQFVTKWYDPKTSPERVWKSCNVSKFVTPPPGLDKRSSKAEEYSITHKSNPGTEFPESYIIRGKPSDEIQIFLELHRPAAIPGFKLGKGDQGGYSYFGTDTKKPEGYVVHRFWPRLTASGHVIIRGKAETIKGTGMFAHAIQGMMPNRVASSWNFVDFQSDEHGGVSAIQMEFKTTPTHGSKESKEGTIVNVGSLVIGGKLACVTAQTIRPGDKPKDDAPLISRAIHLNPVHDRDTTYEKPQNLEFRWAGPSIAPGVSGALSANLKVDVGDIANPKGLIEKVDVLAEIPYVLKMTVNYVAGTKPYIYQWFNPATLSITGPDELVPGLSAGLEIPGHLYNEATFIS
ncbi:oxidative stress survival, Svf1-like protein [Pluteus cervinus]|uniref:Oxidative stress survival, Svf1-like protein n=1 Tax=Pluteus cervinus TaxID=181527 RepID=A0ACD3BBY5_9AGAR|nr:oxidative stress survival, Svf1-like protein [Pluteus cervinus]